jgi:hypothetical protein
VGDESLTGTRLSVVGSGRYEVVQHEHYVGVTLGGRPDLETVRSMFRELENLTTPGRELLVLIDESEMSPAFISPTNLRLMMDAWRGSEGLRSRARISVYAPSSVMYGLNRMAQTFAGQALEGRLHVSRSEDEARAWLLGSRDGAAA